MIYSNDDPMAIYAMERERTGNYGDYNDQYEVCPICGMHNPEYYYVNEDDDCIGCSECVYKTDFLS